MNTGMNGIAEESAADRTRELLARLWKRSLPLLHERLDALDAAAHTEVLPADLRSYAIDAAHKLAGSLGMFGYPEATDIARKMEQLLEAPGTPSPERLTALSTELRASLFPGS
jgi:HPt (histidine-containing phosphotransfer) domain-containing protein